MQLKIQKESWAYNMLIKTKEWLIDKRVERSLTQAELAKNTGVSKATIENIEQGKRMGSVETWEKLINFFEKKDEINPKISYECEDLINEIEADIAEFGEDYPCALIYKIVETHNVLFVDYMFLPFDVKSDLSDDESYIETTLKYTLDIFKAQDKIL